MSKTRNSEITKNNKKDRTNSMKVNLKSVKISHNIFKIKMKNWRKYLQHEKLTDC